MPFATLIFIIVIAIILVLVVIGSIFILARSKKKKPAPLPPTRPIEPPAPPKFINDPPEVRQRQKPPSLQPLRVETPLPQTDDGEQQKIRILVVDDNRGTTENVTRLIYFEHDMEVIGQAYDGRQGVEMASELKPHIVLMDINMPDMDGITATREMRDKAPFSQIIIMSVQADPEYMRQAMAAGARDFQPKPFTADELVSCIRRVYKIGQPTYQSIAASEAAAHRRARSPIPTPGEPAPVLNAPVVLVFSPKGGTGTSSMAVNLALAWQKAHGDVILVDGDLQFGDVVVHLNTHIERGMGDLTNMDDLDADIISQVLMKHRSGLTLLLPPAHPELAELVSPTMLTRVIEHLKTSSKLVVIDTGSVLSDQTLALVDTADYILLNTSPELPSVKSSKLFIDLLIDLNIPSEKIGVVVNRADMPGGIPAEQIKGLLKVERLYIVPNDDEMVIITNRGDAVVEKKADSPVGQALLSISEQVWQYVVSPNENGDAIASP